MKVVAVDALWWLVLVAVVVAIIGVAALAVRRSRRAGTVLAARIVKRTDS